MVANYGMMNPYMTSLNADAMMNAPLMSFNSGMTSPIAPGMPMMPGMYTGLGNFGLVGGFNNQKQYMDNIQEWDNFGVSRQVAGFKNQNNAQFQMQAQNGSIERQARILAEQIKQNNQDNIRTEYDKLIQTIKSAYGSQMQGSEDEKLLSAKQYADQVYAQVTGTYMTDDIRANSSSSFVSGIKQVLTFGFGNKTTADENIAYITGAKQTTGSKASTVAGNIVGGLLGGLVAVGAFLIGKGRK